MKAFTSRSPARNAANLRRRVLLLVLSWGAWGATVRAEPAIHAPEPDLERAGWTLVTASDETFVYMKDAPGGGIGSVRQAWTVYDSARKRDRAGFAFMSVKSLGEFDCGRRLARVLHETFHAERGLGGLAWEPPAFVVTDWAAPEDGSVGELRMAFACRARKAA